MIFLPRFDPVAVAFDSVLRRTRGHGLLPRALTRRRENPEETR